MVATTARNATLGDLAALLQTQQARKVDMVVPASKIRAEEGLLRVTGSEPVITDDGVDLADGLYRPTMVCDEGVSAKLEIPLAYLRRLRNERPDLYDANVNGWLHGRKPKTRTLPERREVSPGVFSNVEEVRPAIPGDDRNFLFRTFRPDEEGGVGIGRALLSERFKVMDNLDVLTAALDGVRQAGAEVSIESCDLTERRMSVKIVAPAVQALAPVLLANYRSPFGREWNEEQEARWRAHAGYAAGEEPVIFAGFVLSNSETGGGAFSITPRMVIRVCKNGLTITKDALRSVHLGSKMDEGVIRWTDDTQEKNLALVTAKTRDAVATFLDVEYMKRVIAEIESKSDKPVNAKDAVQIVGKRLQFSQATIDGVLEHFVRGGDVTAGGVMNAVTAFAQTVDDPDLANDLEAQGLRALEVAAAL